jgi:hypothetical protein
MELYEPPGSGFHTRSSDLVFFLRYHRLHPFPCHLEQLLTKLRRRIWLLCELHTVLGVLWKSLGVSNDMAQAPGLGPLAVALMLAVLSASEGVGVVFFSSLMFLRSDNRQRSLTCSGRQASFNHPQRLCNAADDASAHS